MKSIINARAEPDAASTWPEVEARRRAKGGAAIGLSEYDFSAVPDGELRTCVHYEYARESAKIIEIVEGMRVGWRDQLPQGEEMVGKEFNLSMRITKFTKTHLPEYRWNVSGEFGFPIGVSSGCVAGFEAWGQGIAQGVSGQSCLGA